MRFYYLSTPRQIYFLSTIDTKAMLCYYYLMAKITLYRMTVNWQGEAEVKTAERFKNLVGSRLINQTIKNLIRDWLKRRAS